MTAEWLATVRLVDVLPWVGAAVMVAANIDNVRGTWTGRWGSSPVTWGIWALLGWVAFAAQVSLGGGPAALLELRDPASMLLLLAAGTATAVAAGALYQLRRHGPRADEVAWQRRVNQACTVGGLISLQLLLIASDATALLLTIVTDIIAATPTFTLAWTRPQDQPVVPFAGVAVASVCTVLASDWSVWQVLYPTYLIVVTLGITVLITVRRARAADPVVPQDWPPKPVPVLRAGSPADDTTEDVVPLWARSPHAAALRKLIPADLLPHTAVPARRVLDVVETAYIAGHVDGWTARDQCPPPLRARPLRTSKPNPREVSTWSSTSMSPRLPMSRS